MANLTGQFSTHILTQAEALVSGNDRRKNHHCPNPRLAATIEPPNTLPTINVINCAKPRVVKSSLLQLAPKAELTNDQVIAERKRPHIIPTTMDAAPSSELESHIAAAMRLEGP